MFASAKQATSALEEEDEEEEEEEKEEEEEEEDVRSPQSWPGSLPSRPFPTLNQSFLKSITPFSIATHAHLRAPPTLTTPFTTTALPHPTITTAAKPIPTPLGTLLSKPAAPFVHPMPTLFTIIPPGLLQAPVLPPSTEPGVSCQLSSPLAATPASTTVQRSFSFNADSSSESQLSSPTKTLFDLTKPVAGKPIVTLASIPQDELTPAHIELKEFAEEFKTRRIKLGYTQGAVGHSLAEKGYSNFAQSTISRFEQLQLSPSNAAAIRQVLERWLRETENPSAVVSTSEPPIPSRKRKKRAVYTTQTRQMLDDYFQKDPRPNRAIIEMIAQELDLLPEEVRVWFCNKRQKYKHSVSAMSDEATSPCSPASSSSNIPSKQTSPSPSHVNFSIEELSKSSTNSKAVTTFSPIQFTSHLSMVTPRMSTSAPIIFSPTGQQQLQFGFTTSPPTVFTMANPTA